MFLKCHQIQENIKPLTFQIFSLYISEDAVGSVLDFLFFKLKIENAIIHSLPVFRLEEMNVPVLPRKQTKGMSMDRLPFFTISLPVLHFGAEL